MSDELKTLKELANKFKAKTEQDMKSILNSKGKGQSRIINLINIKMKFQKDKINLNLNLPEYSKWVDEGRRPGKQPPIKNIIDWCYRKSIDIKYSFPIARKIGKFGLPPTNFLDPWKKFSEMFSEYTPKLTQEIIENIRKELAKTQLKKQ